MYVIESGTRPFAFIAHPKTGSQSCRLALKRDLRAQQVRGHHTVDEPTVDRLTESNGIIACTVRNPFDVMVSWYFYSHRHADQLPDFSEWVTHTIEAGNGWIEQGMFYGAKHCNAIIRFEDGVERQLNRFLTKCGLPNVSLDYVGSTKHNEYRYYYEPAIKNLVFNRFKKEFQEFDYRW